LPRTLQELKDFMQKGRIKIIAFWG